MNAVLSRRQIAPLLGAVALGACTVGQTATVTSAVTTGLTTAQSTLSEALTFYGIVKGIAQVAAASNPAIAGAITVATTVLDGLAASGQQLLATAQTDVTPILSLASQIKAQAVTLATTAAPAIKVISNKV